jgi:4-alpha-glucanotransferase
MSHAFLTGRHAGILVPLFSIPSSSSWGIGEIPDLLKLARWLRDAGQDFVQLLPVTAVAEGETSPYSALSAMAIDHAYIGVEDVQDFRDIGGLAAMRADLRTRLDRVRAARTVDYIEVRALKSLAFEAAFDHFLRQHWMRDTQKAAELRAFIEREHWWLDDYALFRAVRTANACRAWWEWEEDLRTRDPDALVRASRTFEQEILLQKYLQWIADSQWHEVRSDAGLGIFGDYPFMVSRDSADVWARQGEFLQEASVGTPPDAFSETGQNWGLPVYRWDVMAAADFQWLRERAVRSASLYDGYRIDHLVGFYRTFVRPPDARPYFTPEAEADQLAQGERLMQIFLSSGPVIIAEDLGVIPDFVRASLRRLDLPGYRVLRWERDWHAPAKPFKDPREWPATSVATSGTHDTEPLVEWWANADGEERGAFLRLPQFQSFAGSRGREFTPALRDAILQALFQSGSRYLILPIGDVFGWPDRINKPAVVADENWRWRLPWPVDHFSDHADARERSAFLRRHTEGSGRLHV